MKIMTCETGVVLRVTEVEPTPEEQGERFGREWWTADEAAIYGNTAPSWYQIDEVLFVPTIDAVEATPAGELTFYLKKEERVLVIGNELEGGDASVRVMFFDAEEEPTETWLRRNAG